MSKKPAPLVTRDTVQAMIDECVAKNDKERLQHVIGRALLVLFNRQTEGEKQANTTDRHNGIGFTGADGRSGVLTAKSYLARKSLQEWQVERWTRKGSNGYARICKYAGQLNEAAVAKAARLSERKDGGTMTTSTQGEL